MKTRFNILFAILLSALSAATEMQAQSTGSSMAFLELPASARGAALGGNAVSVQAHDPAQFIQNPALLSRADTSVIGLGGMSWLAGTVVAGAQYCNSLGERARYGFSARYVDYGSSPLTMPDATQAGTFSSKDMAAGVSCSYGFTDHLDGGVTGNVICSHYYQMTQVSVGVDLGLLYTEETRGLSMGIAARNLGGQVKAFENEFQKLPFNLCAGISWKMEHAPMRFTLSMDQLTRWDRDDFLFADDSRAGFGEMLKRHTAIGAELLLGESFYVAAGCNLRTRAELSSPGNRSLTGFSFGTGARLNRFSFDVAMGRYQVSTSSILMNFSFRI